MGKKIDALQLLTSGGIDQSSDLVVVFDSTTQTAKKMTVVDFLSLAQSSLDIGSLTILTGPNIDVVDDYLVIRSDADGQLYKVSPKELFTTYTIEHLQNLNPNQVVTNQDFIGILDGSTNIYHKISVEHLLSLAPPALLQFWEESLGSNFSGNVFSQLTPKVSGSTNVPAVIAPKGNAAFQLRGTGSNRGQRAVDLQIFSSGTAEVAGASFSCITHGTGNQIEGNADYSRVGGLYAFSDQFGMDVWANSSASNSAGGGNQHMRTIVRNLINGTTATLLYKNPSDTNTHLQLNTFQNLCWNVTVRVVVVCTAQGGGTVTVGEVFVADYKAAVKRRGATSSLVGAQQTIGTPISDTNMATTAVTISVNDSTDRMEILVTPPSGAASDSQFHATAHVEIVQMLR
jgi:hypothetical protein